MYRETNRRRLLSDLGVHVPAYTVLSAERRSGVGEFDLSDVVRHPGEHFPSGKILEKVYHL